MLQLPPALVPAIFLRHQLQLLVWNRVGRNAKAGRWPDLGPSTTMLSGWVNCWQLMVNSLSGWDDLEWQQVTWGQRNKWSTWSTHEGSSRNPSGKLPSILGHLEHSSETLALPHVLWMWLVNSQEEQEAPVRSHVEQQTLWLGISLGFSSLFRRRTLTFLLPNLADYLLPEFLPLSWTFWPIFANMDGMRRVNSRVDMFGNLVIFKIHSLVHHCHLCHWKILHIAKIITPTYPPASWLPRFIFTGSRPCSGVQVCLKCHSHKITMISFNTCPILS